MIVLDIHSYMLRNSGWVVTWFLLGYTIRKMLDFLSAMIFYLLIVVSYVSSRLKIMNFFYAQLILAGNL